MDRPRRSPATESPAGHRIPKQETNSPTMPQTPLAYGSGAKAVPPGPPRHGTRTALISLEIPKLVRFHKSALALRNNGIIIPLGCRRRAAFWLAASTRGWPVCAATARVGPGWGMTFRALQVRQKPGGELRTGKITGDFFKTPARLWAQGNGVIRGTGRFHRHFLSTRPSKTLKIILS